MDERFIDLRALRAKQRKLWKESQYEPVVPAEIGQVVWMDPSQKLFGTVDEKPSADGTVVVINIGGEGGKDHWGMWPVRNLIPKVD